MMAISILEETSVRSRGMMVGREKDEDEGGDDRETGIMDEIPTSDFHVGIG